MWYESSNPSDAALTMMQWVADDRRAMHGEMRSTKAVTDVRKAICKVCRRIQYVPNSDKAAAAASQ